MSFWDRWRKRKEQDRAYETASQVEREELPFEKGLPHYTWEDIRRLEEEKVPWLKRRRREQ